MTSIYWEFKWCHPPRDTTCCGFSVVRDGLYQTSRCYWRAIEFHLMTTHKLFLGWALTPALPTVVLVSFNHVTTLALVQLGIQNNYSNNLSLEIIKGALTSPKQDSPANQVTRSFDWLGEADLVLPDWQNPVPGPSGPEYLYLYGGAGPSLVIDCACLSHELLKHMDQHSRSHQQWVLIPSTPRVFHQQCQGLEGKQDGKTSSTQISVTYSWHHLSRVFVHHSIQSY